MVERLIIQNDDRIPDDILATILIRGLPEDGAARYHTSYGDILVFVVSRRKSRVYTFNKALTDGTIQFSE